LEFVTNSRTLSLVIEALATPTSSSRKFFAVAVFCNGEKLGLIGSETEACGIFDGTYALPEGENTVCIYLPWSVACTVRALTLDDGASLVPVKKKCKMIQFGDSITHGYDAHEPQNSYASAVADAFSADARNKAIGGEIFQPTLASLKDEGFDPDYVTVAYGTNDWSHRERKDLEDACRGFYANLAATYPEAEIFALTPIWREQENEYRAAGPFRDVAEIIRASVADLPNVTVIDAYGFVPKEPACFSSDMLHPSDLGFFHYGKNLVAELKKYIKQ
jgi:lysophospholipase L1-like esterase